MMPEAPFKKIMIMRVRRSSRMIDRLWHEKRIMDQEVGRQINFLSACEYLQILILSVTVTVTSRLSLVPLYVFFDVRIQLVHL